MTDERSPAVPPRLGALLADRYRLEQRVGRGGMADVYRARDERLHRDVAVKLFRLDSTEAELDADRARIDAETRVLAGLRHPGLVTLYDGSAGDDTSAHVPYLVMEYVAGSTLRARLAREGAVPPDQVAQLGARLADALGYVHERGLVHRDVKPANILVESDDPAVVKLTDFGIAQLVDGTRITAHGTTVGTANYLSPEQALGRRLDAASDVYSLGLVLIECLTGAIAFPGVGVEAALGRLHRDPPVPHHFGDTWTQLLGAMTSRDPRLRPDAAGVAQTLTAASAVDNHVTAAVRAPTAALPAVAVPPPIDGTRPLPLNEIAASPRRHRRWLPVLLATAVVAVLAAVLAVVLSSGSGSGTGSTAGGSTAAGPRQGTRGQPRYAAVPGRLGEDLRALEQALPTNGPAARQLQSDALDLARAISLGHRTRAQAALATLRTDVTAAAAAGSVGPDRVSAIRSALARVQTDLAPASSAPASPSIVGRTSTAPARSSAVVSRSGPAPHAPGKGPNGKGPHGKGPGGKGPAGKGPAGNGPAGKGPGKGPGA